MLLEDAADRSVATDFECAMERLLEERDARQRQKQAFECELHLQDFRAAHKPLASLSNAKAAVTIWQTMPPSSPAYEISETICPGLTAAPTCCGRRFAIETALLAIE
jgi:hypothetical protein